MAKKVFNTPEIEKIGELSAKLIVANEKLTKSENLRTEMLSNISHDLRAPMTAIRSIIDYMISKAEKDELEKVELKQLLNSLSTRTETLETLIDDLYYLTSLEAPSKQLQCEEIQLGSFLEEFFFMTELDSKFENKELILNVPEGFDGKVFIDAKYIIRVLDNLFTNAAKYSKDGAKIILDAYKDNDKAVFFVKDTGIGIPEDAIERVFDRAYTVSSARTPGSPTGSGLGLSIVKLIVEKHEGRVWCESKVGEGSTFFVELPLR